MSGRSPGIDPRLRAFDEYLEECVAAQNKRPYEEREDIERTLRVYGAARGAYEKLVDFVTEGKYPSDLDKMTDPYTKTSVRGLELRCRAYNLLIDHRISNIDQLVEKTPEELLEIRGFGKTYLREVRAKLNELNLHLKTDESWTPPPKPS